MRMGRWMRVGCPPNHNDPERWNDADIDWPIQLRVKIRESCMCSLQGLHGEITRIHHMSFLWRPLPSLQDERK